MANQSDSFIDEVSEAVRRDRLNLWFRRWGWLILLAVLLVVAAAAWIEWRQSQRQAKAELRGEAILSALELPEGADRLAALEELPRGGHEGVLASLLLAAEQEEAGDAEAASTTLGAVAEDGEVPGLWRDLAAFKAQLVLGSAADPAALQALSAPGEPFRLLALEQWAAVDIAAGRTEEAIARLREVAEDAEVTPAQEQRVDSLLTALGAGPEEAPRPTAGPTLEPAAAVEPSPEPAPSPATAVEAAGPAVDPAAEPRPAAVEAPAEGLSE